MSIVSDIVTLLRGDPQADSIVPRTGQAAWLTLAVSAAMAFLAVCALAFATASGQLADRWSAALAQSATIRLSAADDQIEIQTRAILTVLGQTPGVAEARLLSDDEQRALLEPWFGPDLPIGDLPVPRLFEITEDARGFDATGLRQRLAAEAPGAVLDDHTRWRRPLVAAADHLRLLGWLSLSLILGATAAMITLAAQAALAANVQVLRVMRLVGAQDSYIARAFVRRFTHRALTGGGIGAALGMTAILLLPQAAGEGGFLTGLGFRGTGWLWPLSVPVLAAITAFWATRFAAFRTLKGLR